VGCREEEEEEEEIEIEVAATALGECAWNRDFCADGFSSSRR